MKEPHGTAQPESRLRTERHRLDSEASKHPTVVAENFCGARGGDVSNYSSLRNGSGPRTAQLKDSRGLRSYLEPRARRIALSVAKQDSGSKKRKAEAVDEKLRMLQTELHEEEQRTLVLEEQLSGTEAKLRDARKEAVWTSWLTLGGGDAVCTAPSASTQKLHAVLLMIEADKGAFIYPRSADYLQHEQARFVDTFRYLRGDRTVPGSFSQWRDERELVKSYGAFCIRYVVDSAKAASSFQKHQEKMPEGMEPKQASVPADQIAASIDFNDDELRRLADVWISFSSSLDDLRRERIAWIAELASLPPKRSSASSSARAALKGHCLMAKLTSNIQSETAFTCEMILGFLQTATLQQLAQVVVGSSPRVPDFWQILRCAVSPASA